VYSNIHFNTYSLPCFNSLYKSFYLEGKKVIPANIGELLPPLGLAYLIADAGSFNKTYRVVIINTQNLSLDEVNLLIKVLSDKFHLKATINKNRDNYVIRISAESLKDLQVLLKDIMPQMMQHKIGL